MCFQRRAKQQSSCTGTTRNFGNYGNTGNTLDFIFATRLSAATREHWWMNQE
jgi:hypothetical protein